MNKKLKTLLLIIILLLSISGCGTTKLENKKEIADYYKMVNGKFDAQYTYLDKVIPNGGYECELYPDNDAIIVYEDGTKKGYVIVAKDCDKESTIKSKMGTIISDQNIKINNAEVVAESLKGKETFPILLVNQEDIEIIKEIELQNILESNKSYDEIPDIFTYMMNIKDDKLNYDKEKYSQRVNELMGSYEEYIKKMHDEEKESKENVDYNNIPQNVSYKARFGEFKEANRLGKDLTIKFKITPSTSNKTTIDQNGFNVEDLILNQGASGYDTINYWAVADMTDGSESKVISFTVNKGLINAIKEKRIVGNQIIDYASDVWILPSLKQ